MSYTPDTFEVGEVAIYWRPGSDRHRMEVTIAGPAYMTAAVDEGRVLPPALRYPLKENPTNHPYGWATRPCYLRKKRPPAAQWSDCAWQPAKVKA